MRLIDADALHEALMTKQKWVVRCGDKHNEGYTYDQVHFAIDEAPTIEAVSIDDYRSMENTCYKLQKALYDMADRKTEPQTERIKTHDYCDICNHKGCGNCIANNLDDYCVPSGYEPTTQMKTQNSNLTFEKRCKGCRHYKLTCDLFSEVCKYEPTTEDCSTVDKDINVRSKDEPQTNADQHVQRVEYVGNDRRSRCWKCKHFERMHETPISSDGSYYTYVVCTASECRYEPKTEPQCETCEHKDDEWYSEVCSSCSIEYSNYKPQSGKERINETLSKM